MFAQVASTRPAEEMVLDKMGPTSACLMGQGALRDQVVGSRGFELLAMRL